MAHIWAPTPLAKYDETYASLERRWHRASLTRRSTLGPLPRYRAALLVRARLATRLALLCQKKWDNQQAEIWTNRALADHSEAQLIDWILGDGKDQDPTADANRKQGVK